MSKSKVASHINEQLDQAQEVKADELFSDVEYPTLMYICPGDHQAKGATFSFIPVENDAEFLSKLDEGYSATLPEAINKLKVKGQ